MRWKEMVTEKGGSIIKEGEDIFSEHNLVCKNDHSFSLFANDILIGKWCPECEIKKDDPLPEEKETLISEILKELSLPYECNKVIDSIECDYVIEGKKKFIISFEKNVSIKGYKQILITSISEESKQETKEDVWEAIRENRDYTEIPKAISEHPCTITRVLKEQGDVASVVKEAPLPYPVVERYGVGYIRVSTKEQVRDGFSLEAQERQIIEEARKYSIFLKKIYIDKGISGGSTDKRLALEEMRDTFENDEWVIICYISRMARNAKDFLTIVDEIKDKNGHLVIREIDIDITTSIGGMFLTVMASLAQFEREQVSDKVKSVFEHLKKTGQFRSKPCFGMRMNPDHSSGAPIHIPNDAEQKTIGKIREYRKKYPHLGITAFSEKLNLMGLPPPRKSKKWYHKVVKDIMTREDIL
jgi:DNA invertase Pin-like site-specific DNA recombinase